MSASTLPGRKAALLPVLCAVAAEGRRCPTARDLMVAGHAGSSETITALAEQGLIRVEVYGRNWRVVEIVATGDRTAESPLGGEPYLVIERKDTR